MAVLITGATGMIGRVLAPSLAAAGMEVRVLTRRPHRAAEAFGDSVAAFEWHPIFEPVPPAAVAGAATIVHLMGDPINGPLTPEKSARLSRSRVVATGRLIDALAGSPFRLITASSVGIYNACQAGSPGPAIKESTPLGEPAGFLQNAVREWESAAEPCRWNGGSVAHLRLGLVIAPDGFPMPIVALHDKRCGVIFESDNRLPVIALADAAAMFAWLVLNPDIDGPVNAVAPVALTGKAINEALAAGSEGRYRLKLPLWLTQRAFGIEADLIFGNRHIEPQRALEAGFTFSHPDPTASLIAARKKQEAAMRAKAKAMLPAWLREALDWAGRKAATRPEESPNE